VALVNIYFKKNSSEKTSNVAAAIHRKASRAVTKHSHHVFLGHTPAREVECLPILGTGKLVLKGIKEIASGGSGWLMRLKGEL